MCYNVVFGCTSLFKFCEQGFSSSNATQMHTLHGFFTADGRRLATLLSSNYEENIFPVSYSTRKKYCDNLYDILRNIELLYFQIYERILTQIAKSHVRFSHKCAIIVAINRSWTRHCPGFGQPRRGRGP